MQMQKPRKLGLIADLWPNIQLIHLSGLFFSAYYDHSTLMRLLHTTYSWFATTVLFAQFISMTIYATTMAYDADQRASYTVTLLFFTHSVIKFIYISTNNDSVVRTLSMWNNPNSHPLFAESNARHRAKAVSRMRKLLLFVGSVTITAVVAWIILTMLGDSTRLVRDPETENGSMVVEVPRLPLNAWYPMDVMSGVPYIVTFAIQVYFILIALSVANLADSLFDSLVLVSCQQLKHLKEIMGPLIELSAALDTQVPNAEILFRIGSAGSKTPLINQNEDFVEQDDNYQNNRNILSTITSDSAGATGGPNGLTRKQEILVRSAIKYWVERHKHIVRYVTEVGDMYGLALLFHMLIATFTLTLLAYQATQIRGINKFAFSTIGYLVYTLGQIYLFCSYGNELIDESSSVMEAAYSCSWYDGSEEAKTFVQIVCQQCQKALTVTGAKFFIVSLDLFASVLGAVVTYFMVLIQLS